MMKSLIMIVKMALMPSRLAHLIWLPLLFSLGCNEAVEMQVMNTVIEKDAEEVSKIIRHVNVNLNDVCSDVAIETEDGQRHRGKRDCDGVKPLCLKVGDIDCKIENPELYGLDPKDLKPQNVKSGVKVGSVTGSYVVSGQICKVDGDSQCVATADFPAVKIADVKAKVLEGKAIGEHQGQFRPDLPPAAAVRATATTGSQRGLIAGCADASKSGCIVPGSHVATEIAKVVPGHIKRNETINGVRGDFRTTAPVCTADGGSSCLVEGSFRALDSSRLLSSNLEQGYSVLAVGGTAKRMPANCAADGARDCVAHGGFAAIDASKVNEGEVRRGVTIGGVTGDYPSARYPLTGSQPAVADLKNDTFAGSLANAAAFEYWDANGNRYTATGSADLVATNILKDKTLFGVPGSLVESLSDCAADNGQGCVATSSFPAIKKSLLNEGNIRSGVTIAGVTGQYPSAAYPLVGKGANADLDFPANLAGNHSVVFWNAAGEAFTVAAAPGLQQTNILASRTILGVAGNATASPPLCSSHNQTGCVSRPGFPSYQVSRLNAANIKNGETITGPSGTVTGIFPSSAAPFKPTAAGAKKLTGSNFNASIGSSQTFEFWDSTGQMHTFQGDADFAADNLLKDVTAFGLTGTYRPQPAACSATKATDCVASPGRPTYDSSALTADMIKNNVRIGNLRGIYPSAAAPLQGATAAADLQSGSFNTQVSSAAPFEYWDSAGVRRMALGDAAIRVTDNIRSGVTILGNLGTQAESPNFCTAELQQGCVVRNHFKTLDATLVNRRNIAGGVNVLGVTGSYPSAGNTLPVGPAHTVLTPANWDASLASASMVKFWNSAGEVQTARGSTLLVPGNIAAGTTVFGVAGNVRTSSGPCSAAGQEGCTATASFPSYDKNALTPAVIKNTETVLGVTGAYVSATHPLSSGGFTGSTLSDNFNSAVTSNSQFQFWDATGKRYQVAGDGDIVPANLRQGLTMFGVTGNVTPYPTIDPWDVIYGETYTDSSGATKTGQLRLNCRNMTDSSASARLTDSSVQIYKHIDDYNNGRSRMPNQNPFQNDAYKCNGEAFADVSYHAASSTQRACGQPGVTCIYKDRISQLSWLQASSATNTKSRSDAATECQNSTAGGKSNWRLPTKKEALMAYVHGIRDISLRVSGNAGRYPVDKVVWTNTEYSLDSRDTRPEHRFHGYTIDMARGIAVPAYSYNSARVLCVHN